MRMGRKKEELLSVWFISILPPILAGSFGERAVKNILVFSTSSVTSWEMRKTMNGDQSVSFYCWENVEECGFRFAARWTCSGFTSELGIYYPVHGHSQATGDLLHGVSGRPCDTGHEEASRRFRRPAGPQRALEGLRRPRAFCPRESGVEACRNVRRASCTFTAVWTPSPSREIGGMGMKYSPASYEATR